MEKDYLKDISEIKSIMNKSTRFISLSGLSGILAGVYALIGAFIANYLIGNHQNYANMVSYLPISYLEYLLLIIALLVLSLSILTAYGLSSRKARKNGEKMWDASAKRLVINFLILTPLNPKK